MSAFRNQMQLIRDFNNLAISGKPKFDKNYFPKATEVRVYQNVSNHLASWLPHPDNDIYDDGYNLYRIKQRNDRRLYKSIVNPIRSSFGSEITITEVYEVDNSYLKRQYELKKIAKEEYFQNCEEQTLYHVTLPENVDEICTNNFNWRFTTRHRFGYGISFTPEPVFGHKFQRGYSLRVILVCKVLICYTHHGNSNTILPEDGFDTTCSPNGNGFMKYEDSEYYPEYAVYYKYTGDC